MNNSKKRIHILLADDHELLLDTMAQTLSLDNELIITAKARNGQEALRLAAKLHPDIALLDIQMGQPDGFEVAKKIKKFSPGTRIIGLSMFTLPAYAKKMKAAGASGYITKSSPVRELIKGIKLVYNGENYLCEQITRQFKGKTDGFDAIDSDAHLKLLTAREIEIITLIKKGFTSREIAEQLFISPKTINIHRNHIFHKLNVGTVTALLSAVQTLGL